MGMWYSCPYLCTECQETKIAGSTYYRRRTCLLRGTNLIVIMPNTNNGWYTDTQYGYNYYTVPSRRVTSGNETFLPNMTSKARKDLHSRFSTGGYGLFKPALSIKSFFMRLVFLVRSVFLQEFSPESQIWGHLPTEVRRVFGEIKDWTASPHSLESMATKSDKKTKLWAWVWEQDYSPTLPITSQWKISKSLVLRWPIVTVQEARVVAYWEK